MQSVWTYTIQLTDTANSFQHFAIQLCSVFASEGSKSDFTVERSDDNGTTFTNVNGFQLFTTDNLMNLTNDLRINESGNPGTFTIFRITILNASFFNLAAEAGTVAIRDTNTVYTFDTTYDISTPSINCNIVTPTQPPRGITIEDTTKIKEILEETNAIKA